MIESIYLLLVLILIGIWVYTLEKIKSDLDSLVSELKLDDEELE